MGKPLREDDQVEGVFGFDGAVAALADDERMFLP